MSHEHDHEAPQRASPSRERPLLIAFALTATMLVIEALGGFWSGSLALLADAGHMLVDAGALLFAWFGAHVARRPADARRSFGYARVEVLVGYSNALLQFLLVAWIIVEAVARFRQPRAILSLPMFAVAVAGLIVNAVVLFVLREGAHGHDHADINTAGARLHVLGDLLGSIGAIAAAILIGTLGWLWSDAAISILVSLLILAGAWRLLRRSAHILLEGTPDDLDANSVTAALREARIGVSDVHHVHVWQLGGAHRIATLHARLENGVDTDRVVSAIRDVLRERLGIAHTTVQVDLQRCADTACVEH